MRKELPPRITTRQPQRVRSPPWISGLRVKVSCSPPSHSTVMKTLPRSVTRHLPRPHYFRRSAWPRTCGTTCLPSPREDTGQGRSDGKRNERPCPCRSWRTTLPAYRPSLDSDLAKGGGDVREQTARLVMDDQVVERQVEQVDESCDLSGLMSLQRHASARLPPLQSVTRPGLVDPHHSRRSRSVTSHEAPSTSTTSWK